MILLVTVGQYLTLDHPFSSILNVLDTLLSLCVHLSVTDYPRDLRLTRHSSHGWKGCSSLETSRARLCAQMKSVVPRSETLIGRAYNVDVKTGSHL